MFFLIFSIKKEQLSPGEQILLSEQMIGNWQLNFANSSIRIEKGELSIGFTGTAKGILGGSVMTSAFTSGGVFSLLAQSGSEHLFPSSLALCKLCFEGKQPFLRGVIAYTCNSDTWISSYSSFFAHKKFWISFIFVGFFDDRTCKDFN